MIWEQINKNMGIIIANIILLIIVILFKIYYDKKSTINEKIAYQKNIEDGYIKKTQPLPKKEGRLKKLYKNIKK